MKIALIKNIPLGILLRKGGAYKIDWVGYGFDLATWSDHYIDGKTTSGDQCHILPIRDEEVFNSHVPYFQIVLKANGYPLDSISVITEEEAKIVHDDIHTIIAAKTV